MQWICSGIGELWPKASPFKEAALSAIAAVYTTKYGFAIGADGRARLSDQAAATEAQKRMESEQEQKIFEAKTGKANLAYAVTGTGYNADKTFSVVVETQKAATDLAMKEFANHLEYVERFSQFVSERIAEAHKEGRFDYLPTPTRLSAPGKENTIVHLFFCGYFRATPFAYDVEIVNEAEILACYPTQTRLREMAPMVLGSKKIAELIYKPDNRFKKYAVRITETSPMQDAIACVRGYLEACSTPLARKLDPFCEIVGGHIHIATVTPQCGFQWSTPPKKCFVK
jgi:hypothetical protein